LKLDFIRDPDDPEFHPVRDVLERNVTTQLRKILFSALVYGALVIVCLGGVVWTLSLSAPNVLPIHYSSNEPVLEFPVDLLFYNFLMPLAVKFFKPSDGLYIMYTWWFRKCARGLRLTWFLFGERRIDEEGTLLLAEDSPHHNSPWWKKAMLEVSEQKQVVPKTWQDTFDGGTAKPISAIPQDDMITMNVAKNRLVDSGQIVGDGRFVRTPASDQVKIPKGKSVFLEVSEVNTRLDGKPDLPETDLYSSGQYRLAYVPPLFRLRIFLFILFIWIFAAVTGVGFTIVPLIFGRKVFQFVIPAHIRTNDIYAFSIGIYVLGSLSYSVFHSRFIADRAIKRLKAGWQSLLDRDAPRWIIQQTTRACRLAYVYVVLLLFFPLLLTALVELYLIIPLHTYMYPLSASNEVDITVAAVAAPNPTLPSNIHTVRVVQSWTLGLLYLKLGTKAITGLYNGTRLAAAVVAVMRDGWLRPDAAILTRAFLIPGLILALTAILGPPILLYILMNYKFIGHASDDYTYVTTMYRLSFPVAAVAAMVGFGLWNLVAIFNGWKARIRDEVYLMGERLHNFGVGAAGLGGAKVAWRAGGPRL
jgi:E3 ubiquitin-protein ligase MARCH6